MSRFSLSVCVLGITVSAACSTTDLPSAPSALSPSVAASGSASPATSSGSARLAPLRQATAPFHDVANAVAAGYLAPEAGACVTGPTGAMGVHAVHPVLAGDQDIDPLKPEVLLYEPKPGGGFNLVGIEYFQAVLVRNKATGVVSPWFAETPWPADFEVVGQKPSVLGQAFDGPMPGHEPGMPWHYDLHVWVWSQNPDGDFAPFNPRVSCGAAGGGHAH